MTVAFTKSPIHLRVNVISFYYKISVNIQNLVFARFETYLIKQKLYTEGLKVKKLYTASAHLDGKNPWQ